MLKDIVCPISAERVNSNVSRLTVFINAVLMVAFLFSLQPILLYIVTIDYCIRALGSNNYSPICLISSIISKILKWNVKMIDKAPKILASRLGFICAALGTLFITLHMNVAAISVIAAFTILAIMDSVFNYCVGCLIYHSLVFPFFKTRQG
jgi:hypothetical protein